MFNTQGNSKVYKIIPLMVAALILVSSISSVAAEDPKQTHIDGLTHVNCEQGDVVTITAQLWITNYLWDNPLTGEDLYFYVYSGISDDNNILFHRTTETSWPTGEASVQIDTKNINPGNYTLLVHYDGGGDLFGYDGCSKETTFTVRPKSN